MVISLDINEKALTFQTREAYLKKNYLVENETEAEKIRLKKMMIENVLMNVRTYDDNALVLYANDNLNNFIHLFIHNGTEIIYLFNHEDEIVQMNVTHEKINKGESVQIAIIRTVNSTTLHVNDKNTTIDKVAKLLSNYTNKPWKNPNLGNIFYMFIYCTHTYYYLEVLFVSFAHHTGRYFDQLLTTVAAMTTI